MIKRLKYCELARHIIMYDKSWNSCHDYCLIVATSVWRILEAVRTLIMVSVANYVRDITHCLNVNYARDRTWCDPERKVLGDWSQ